MEGYVGQQFVGIDLHRRRSVLVRMTETGEVLESVRIVNDVDRLSEVISRAGLAPEAVIEATYGWYWAVDALRAAGASVHLAHPLGVKAFEYRRLKKTSATRRIWLICCGWVGCRKGGSPHRRPGSYGNWSVIGPYADVRIRPVMPRAWLCRGTVGLAGRWPSVG